MHTEAGGVSMFPDKPGYVIADWHATYLWPRSSLWSRGKSEAMWTIAREMRKDDRLGSGLRAISECQRAILVKRHSLVEQNQWQLENDFVRRIYMN